MKEKATGPRSLLEAVRHYSDLDTCFTYMVKIKWPDGVVTCPKCGAANVGYIASRRMMQCKSQNCRKQFSVKIGTIFEDSPLGLDKWFVAVWCITNAKNGISSCELARALKITQKSAWFLLHRVRLAMKSKTFRKMGGPGQLVEADETFIGGKAEFMHKSRRKEVIKGRGSGGSNKTAVVGLLDRATRKVHAEVLIGNVNRSTLHPIIHKNVEPGTHLLTDAHPGYDKLGDDFQRSFIDHAIGYVDGHVHTNCIENFWSVLKRSLKGTYIRATPKHLFRYLDEQILRFNERKGNDADRFNFVMPNVVGRRIMYRDLIG